MQRQPDILYYIGDRQESNYNVAITENNICTEYSMMAAVRSALLSEPNECKDPTAELEHDT